MANRSVSPDEEKQAKDRHKQITAILQADEKTWDETYLWLFLGPPRSGKSTLVKQLRQIDGSLGSSIEDRRACLAVPVVRWMKALCEQLDASALVGPAAAEAHGTFRDDVKGTEQLDTKLTETI